MPETLLTQSSIKLFGRTLNDLIYRYDANTGVKGSNNFLQNQLNSGAVSVQVSGCTIAAGNLNQVTGVNTLVGLVPGMTVTGPAGAFAPNTIITSIGPGPAAMFEINPAAPAAVGPVSIVASLQGGQVFVARIYAFSFEGALYTLPRPSMFLVHGPGQFVDITGVTGAGTAGGNATTTPIGRSTLDMSGVIAREWEFSAPQNPPGNQDLRYWEYEKGDFSIRLDSEAGPFEQILLQAALRGGADRADRSGQGLDVRSGQGLDVRSGQGLRTGR